MSRDSFVLFLKQDEVRARVDWVEGTVRAQTLDPIILQAVQHLQPISPAAFAFEKTAIIFTLVRLLVTLG